MEHYSEFIEYGKYYSNGILIVFLIGCFIYAFNVDNIKKEMGIFVFFFCNFLIALIWFITMPYLFYKTFWSK